jgi:hypothetical protein
LRYARESKDTPSVNAFCDVAPGVRLSAFAIFATGIFWRARVFSSRTSSLVHSRRFAVLAMSLPNFGWEDDDLFRLSILFNTQSREILSYRALLGCDGFSQQ